MGFTLTDIVLALLGAVRWTIALSLAAFIGGGIAGLVLLAMRISKNALLRRIAMLYIELFQGTPLLMQLFMLFFGMALFGIDTPAWLAAGLGLTLWSSAFLAEIWRGCVQALPRGQWEASESLAMRRVQILRDVILPQAARVALAPTVGFCVQIVKGTAVTSVIGFVELTKAGEMITNATFEPFIVYLLVAIIYFAMCFPLAVCSRVLERRMR